MIAIPTSCPRCNLDIESFEGAIGSAKGCSHNCPISFYVIGKTTADFLVHVDKKIYRLILSCKRNKIIIRNYSGSGFYLEIDCPDDFSFNQQYLENLIHLCTVF